MQKQEERYDSQFAEELEDDAGISEDEYVMKEVFEKLDELQEEEKQDGSDH